MKICIKFLKECMTHCTHGSECYKQWSPNFLAPGTSFIEDNSSTDGGNRQVGMASGWFKCIAFYCSSVTQSFWLCNSMGCSMPDFPVLHHLLELAHTHLHWVSDVFLPSGPLSSPSPPAFNLSQHQSFLMSRLFTSGGPSMEFQLQHQSFQWIIRTDFL